MICDANQKRGRILSVILISLLIAFHRSGADAKSPTKFKVEMLSGDAGPIVSRMWTVATTLIITEPIALRNPCNKFGTEVHIEGRKILVKIKSPENDSEKEADCTASSNRSGVKITIPDLPTGEFAVQLETPQREITAQIRIDW